jgi:hypothetical protein
LQAAATKDTQHKMLLLKSLPEARRRYSYDQSRSSCQKKAKLVETAKYIEKRKQMS